MSSKPSVLSVQNADAVAWDEEADVVIVGFGGAGAATALQALEEGARVIACERFDGGGATALSGGVIYSGGTRYQRESGFDDTADEMYKYLDAEGSAVGPGTLRRFCEGSNGDLEWLETYGVPHGGNAFLEKTSYPPDPHWLYYSGNEKMPAYAAKAKPAPRGHRTVANGFGGHVHYAKLKEAALARGVVLKPHSPVTRLVTDASGAVVGVEVNPLPSSVWQAHQALYKQVDPWRPFNNGRAEKAIRGAHAIEDKCRERRLIRAKRGVVLTTGGFIYNLELLGEHRPLLAQHFMELLRLGSMADDGSGILLGQSVGGATALMQNVCVARTVAPPNAFAHGILVNARGERFVNEAAYSVVVGGAVIEQPEGGKAWLIVDAPTFGEAVRKSFFPGKGMFLAWGAPALLNIFLGGTKRAGTIAKLARKISVDPAGLSATLEAVNAQARDGGGDQFGKLPELIQPLGEGPFYAINMSLENRFAPAPAFTMGGLDVDEDSGAVRRAGGGTIAGLFAAGRVAVGLCSAGYVSGLSIADTVFGGRRAARGVMVSVTQQSARQTSRVALG